MPPQALASTDPPSIGRFTLLNRLGQGGMGVVYLGINESGQAAAVKIAHPGGGTEARQRMQQETAVLSGIRHPGLPTFIDADSQGETPWLAMSYVPGPNLTEVPLPLGETPLTQLARGLASTLSTFHAVGVTHRDIKPANIILTYAGPVLVDLGIARHDALSRVTQAGHVIGTPGWMAPEQLLGSGLGPATDIWAWGAVVTLAATGRGPFGEGPQEALGWRILNSEPDLRGIPSTLAPLVRQALAREAAHRPSAGQLHSMLERSSRGTQGYLSTAPMTQPITWLAPTHHGFSPASAPIPRTPRPIDLEAPDEPLPRSVMTKLWTISGVIGAAFAAVSALIVHNTTGIPTPDLPAQIGSWPTRTPSSTVTIIETTAPTTPGPASWDLAKSSGHPGKTPTFPTAVEGFRRVDSWRTTTRAFVEQWTAVGSPRADFDYRFPATQNGCSTQVFLIRWRTVGDMPIRLRTTVGSVRVDREIDPHLSVNDVDVRSTNGWAVLDGCSTPIITIPVAGVDGGNLEDVAFEVQRWEPSP